MREIELTMGYVAQVDDEDYDYLMQWKWCASVNWRMVYAVSRNYSGGKATTISMHRLILNAPKGMQVDHINHDGLCNLRGNLRICTAAENGRNRRSANKSSGYLGVSKWGGIGGKPVYWAAAATGIGYLGQFKKETDAAECYDMYALRAYGEFANLNFPEKRDDYLSRTNQCDSGRDREMSSPYIGVWLCGGKWRAHISKDYKCHDLGVFSTEIEAAVARDKVAVELYGDAAKLNFPEKSMEYIHTPFRRKRREKSSRFLGVNWHKKSSSWRAAIGSRDTYIHLGLFADEEVAAETRDVAMVKHYGVAAKLNFPDKLNEYLCLINHSEHKEGALNT